MITVGPPGFSGCTAQQVIDASTAKDPETALKNMVRHRAHACTYSPGFIFSDAQKVKSEYGRLMGKLQK